MLNAAPDDKIELRCGDFAMFNARSGQKQGRIAVLVEDDIEHEED